MSGIGENIYPLKNLLESFFELTTLYAQAWSTLIDKATKIKKLESYLKAKEHPELVMKERDGKFGELYDAYQSLEKVGKKELAKRANISLATENALNDVENKKQGLEASLLDLVNYKLCLD
ncbi:hypothetical protein CQW23_07527 [Capsicum baccatum]|uniref:Uncharacterized protein n=1 Tax=Capsicum baccatum TaxID=33114 RepID=A0A2G2X6C9_CAPBA|nr:hypothetical protein CQW23_07527 [Capsicum baccatum]